MILTNVFQVGAIILYTYVFQMLAPPPEGTFDLEDGGLPIKINPVNNVAEQEPLLSTPEPEPIDSNSSKPGKVRSTFYLHVCAEHSLLC